MRHTAFGRISPQYRFFVAALGGVAAWNLAWIQLALDVRPLLSKVLGLEWFSVIWTLIAVLSLLTVIKAWDFTARLVLGLAVVGFGSAAVTALIDNVPFINQFYAFSLSLLTAAGCGFLLVSPLRHRIPPPPSPPPR